MIFLPYSNVNPSHRVTTKTPFDSLFYAFPIFTRSISYTNREHVHFRSMFGKKKIWFRTRSAGFRQISIRLQHSTELFPTKLNPDTLTSSTRAKGCCSHCGRQFRLQATLDHHLATAHTGGTEQQDSLRRGATYGGSDITGVAKPDALNTLFKQFNVLNTLDPTEKRKIKVQKKDRAYTSHVGGTQVYNPFLESWTALEPSHRKAMSDLSRTRGGRMERTYMNQQFKDRTSTSPHPAGNLSGSAQGVHEDAFPPPTPSNDVKPGESPLRNPTQVSAMVSDIEQRIGPVTESEAVEMDRLTLSDTAEKNADEPLKDSHLPTIPLEPPPATVTIGHTNFTNPFEPTICVGVTNPFSPQPNRTGSINPYAAELNKKLLGLTSGPPTGTTTPGSPFVPFALKGAFPNPSSSPSTTTMVSPFTPIQAKTSSLSSQDLIGKVDPSKQPDAETTYSKSPFQHSMHAQLPPPSSPFVLDYPPETPLTSPPSSMSLSPDKEVEKETIKESGKEAHSESLETFPCRFCGKIFRSYKGSKAHRIRSHEKEILATAVYDPDYMNYEALEEEEEAFDFRTSDDKLRSESQQRRYKEEEEIGRRTQSTLVEYTSAHALLTAVHISIVNRAVFVGKVSGIKLGKMCGLSTLEFRLDIPFDEAPKYETKSDRIVVRCPFGRFASSHQNYIQASPTFRKNTLQTSSVTPPEKTRELYSRREARRALAALRNSSSKTELNFFSRTTSTQTLEEEAKKLCEIVQEGVWVHVVGYLRLNPRLNKTGDSLLYYPMILVHPSSGLVTRCESVV